MVVELVYEKSFRDLGSGFKMIREIPIIDFSGFDSDNKKLRNSVAKKVHKAALKAFSFNYYFKKFLFQ